MHDKKENGDSSDVVLTHEPKLKQKIKAKKKPLPSVSKPVALE